ncbi:MAG: type II toxin-antitoxin system VapC family toxin [Blastocatellia bacterium]
MSKALLDTDILSNIMRNNPSVTAKAKNYLRIHGKFTISIITRYEILRGLKAKLATTQIVNFNKFCLISEILPISDSIILRASDIYADLYRKGLLISDADILIASSALEHSLTIVTNNESHFSRIHGLTIENWLKP